MVITQQNQRCCNLKIKRGKAWMKDLCALKVGFYIIKSVLNLEATVIARTAVLPLENLTKPVY